MIYTLVIRLLSEKPFYLLRPQSFSFQIVSEVIDIFVKFSNFISRGWAFDSLFCPEGRVFVHNDCPGGGRVFAPFKSCPEGMVLDEIDTSISTFAISYHMTLKLSTKALRNSLKLPHQYCLHSLLDLQNLRPQRILVKTT